MRKISLILGMTLFCSGCASVPSPVFSSVVSQAVPNDPRCHDYSALATIDNQRQKIVGHACLRDDGTWRIVEGLPDQPAQLVTVYEPPPYAYYPYYDPWLWNWPIGLSLGTSVIFVDHDHQFHRFRFSGRHDDFIFHAFYGGPGGMRGATRGGGGMRHG